jgi:hypothetical protein
LSQSLVYLYAILGLSIIKSSQVTLEYCKGS